MKRLCLLWLNSWDRLFEWINEAEGFCQTTSRFIIVLLWAMAHICAAVAAIILALYLSTEVFPPLLTAALGAIFLTGVFACAFKPTRRVS